MILCDDHVDDEGLICVRESIQQVVRISSNFLTYDKLLQGVSKISYQRVNLCGYTHDILKPIINNCNKAVTVTVTTSAELNSDISIDIDKYSEIFSNLLTNGLKHCDINTPLLIRLRPLPENRILLELINDTHDMYRGIRSSYIFHIS